MLENDDSLEAVGMRLKFLRTMAKLNRIELAEKANVGRTSITCWEHAQTSAMTHKSRAKILKAISDCGVNCTDEWLLTGRGPNPTLKNITHNLKNEFSNSSINDEIELFKNKNSRAVIYELPDNTLSPIYKKGDIVGGIWRSVSELSSCNICILEINNQLEVRQLSKSTKEGYYIASFLSIDEHSSKPFELRDIKLTSIAQISRVWRRD